MGWALAGFLVLQSFFMLPLSGAEGSALIWKVGARISTLREILALWSIYGLLAWVLWKGLKGAPPKCPWIMAFVAWVAIGVIFPLSYYFKQEYFFVSPFGLKIFHYILFFTLAWWLLSGMLTRRDVTIVGTALVLIGTVHAALALVQWAGYPPILWLSPKWQLVDPKHVVGFVGNTWHLAAYLAFILPLALDRFEPWWANLAIYVLIVGALVYTQSTAAIIAAGAGFLVYGGRALLHSYRRWVLVGVALAIPLWIGFFDPPHAFGLERYYIWRTTVKMLPLPGFRTRIPTVFPKKLFLPESSAVFIGYGPSSYQVLFPAMSGRFNGDTWFNYHHPEGSKNRSNINVHAHNEWLQVWFEHGVIGFVMVMGALWWLVKRTLPFMGVLEVRRLAAVLVAVFVHSMFFQTLHMAQLATIGVVAAAGLCVLTEA